MAAAAIGNVYGFARGNRGGLELPLVNIFVAILAQQRQAGQLRALLLAAAAGGTMAGVAGHFAVAPRQGKSRLPVIEMNFSPALHGMAMLAPPGLGVAINLPAVGVLMAILAARRIKRKPVDLEHGTVWPAAIAASRVAGDAGNG